MASLNSPTLSRRSLLGVAAGIFGLSRLTEETTRGAESGGDGAFNFAFLTDIHVTEKLRAAEGLRACINSVNALGAETAFVVTGGDHIMDGLAVDAAEVRAQWALYDECMKELRLPVHHTIGNHDIGGWAPKGTIQTTEPEFGKALFAQKYGLGRTYRSFDHNGWHFILLDSIQFDELNKEYYGWIDDAQLAWLAADLKQVGQTKPVIVVTHIPFFSVWSQLNGDPRKGEGPKSLVNNAAAVRKVLGEYNVKLVLSGHGHVYERIELAHYNRTTYIQGGAVCGLWWRGKVMGNPEGYGVVSCKQDGTFEYEYRGYGWV